MEAPVAVEPVKIEEVKQLVFQGGAVKGIAYVGAYRALIQAGLKLEQLERVAGTSAGAINAMFICMGYTPNEMFTLLDTLNFKTFLDQDKVDIRSVLFDLKDQKGSGFFAKSTSHSVTLSHASSILSQAFGLFEGEVLRLWVEDLIYKKTGIEHLTFAELHQLKLKKPAQFKDLYVIGANVNTHQAKIFSWEHTPEVIISDAVRISMSIPIIFMPHQVYIKKMGLRTLDESQENDLYVDGGVTDNYPLFVFDYHHYLPVNLKPLAPSSLPTRAANPTTLGLMLASKDKHDYLTGVTKEAPKQELLKFMPYVKAVLGTIYHKQDSDLVLAQEQWRTVCIDNCGVNTLDFDLTDAQKQALVNSGDLAVKAFITPLQLNVVPRP